MSVTPLLVGTVDSEAPYPISCKGQAILGLVTACITFGGLALWSTLVPLKSAVIAEATVVVAGNRKSVQHLEGGIVARILVDDGDEVEEGDVLLELADAAAEAELAVLAKQLAVLVARKARLQTERNHLPASLLSSFLIDSESLGAAALELQLPMTTEKRLLQARLATLAGNSSLFRHEITASRQQLAAVEEQQASHNRQLILLQDELERLRQLFDKGYATRRQLGGLERERERLRGESAALAARAAAIRQRITEAELHIVQLEREHQEDVERELADVEAKKLELQEQLRGAADRSRRLAIRAPVSGTVVDLAVHSPGGVIAPGARITDVVPRDRHLFVEAKLPPSSIDGVQAGLEAQIVFSAFDRNRLPPMTGKVTMVSADRIIDPATAASYFIARVSVNQRDLSRLEEIEILPGMPAEVMIAKGERTLLDYLIAPLRDVLTASFRE